MIERLQLQSIADKLAGQTSTCPTGEPYAAIWTRIDPALLSGLGAEQTLWQALRGIPNAHALNTAILAAMPAGNQFPSLARLADDLQPIAWLWPNWLPRGMLSLLGASPGAGKSLVALDLARRIIHNAGFPDGAAIPDPGSPVIYVDAEAVPQIQNQRAIAWNMDRNRLYLMLPGETYGMIDFGAEAHQDRLIEMCHALEPDLIVIDSLSSISVRGENNIEDVRNILGFLSAVAREYEAAVLLIHHLRKRSRLPLMDLVSVDDFRGSSHIIAMARSVLALSIIQDGPEPDRNGPRRMEIVKTNLCRYPAALGLLFEGNGDAGAPTLRYTDPPKPYRDPSETDQCAKWLLTVLTDAAEGMRPRELVSLADDAGWSRATLYRARDQLGDLVLEVGSSKRDPNKVWTLNENAE